MSSQTQKLPRLHSSLHDPAESKKSTFQKDPDIYVIPSPPISCFLGFIHCLHIKICASLLWFIFNTKCKNQVKS